MYSRKIHVYETDLMGIVHHSNYLKLCEEARVAWCESKNLLGNDNAAVFGLTVLETNVKHIKPARYRDNLNIYVQAKIEGIRLIFQYKITLNEQTIVLAKTTHCSLDLNFKVKRLSDKLIEIAQNLPEKEKWTETWL